MADYDKHTFWEEKEQVDRFEDRDPDHRLSQIIKNFATPGQIRVLDLGCAAGRNAVFLAKRGFDLHGLDSSKAMVARTRTRVGAILGHKVAQERIIFGPMDDLGMYKDGFFDLVIALGIYHNARGDREFEATLSESARILVPEGLLLVASFSPDSRPKDGLRKLSGSAHLYEGFRSGLSLYLLTEDELDQCMAEHELYPELPTAVVSKTNEDGGMRVTVNGLYRKST